MDIHGTDMESVKVPVSDLAQSKPRQVAMSEPIIDKDKANAISQGFKNATGAKSLTNNKQGD